MRKAGLEFRSWKNSSRGPFNAGFSPLARAPAARPAPVSTISPTTSPLSVQPSRGDFSGERLAGPNTATGRPRFVIVMGSPNCAISPRQARHSALNSDALRVRIRMVHLTDYDTIPLGPFLRTVQDAGDFDGVATDAVDNYERQPGDHQFAATWLTSGPATAGDRCPGVRRFVNCQGRAAGLCRTKML